MRRNGLLAGVAVCVAWARSPHVRAGFLPHPRPVHAAPVRPGAWGAAVRGGRGPVPVSGSLGPASPPEPPGQGQAPATRGPELDEAGWETDYLFLSCLGFYARVLAEEDTGGAAVPCSAAGEAAGFPAGIAAQRNRGWTGSRFVRGAHVTSVLNIRGVWGLCAGVW